MYVVAWFVKDSIIQILNKEIADAAIFGTKHCSKQWVIIIITITIMIIIIMRTSFIII